MCVLRMTHDVQYDSLNAREFAMNTPHFVFVRRVFTFSLHTTFSYFLSSYLANEKAVI